jgi:hypothetical protein
MIKLGRSQQAVYDWLSKQKEAQTAWDVGNAIYDDVSACSKKNSSYSSEWPAEKIRTSWAQKVIRELVKRKVVWPKGVCGRATTYSVIR